MNDLALSRKKASLREVTETMPAKSVNVRARPSAGRRTQAERTAQSDARMLEAAKHLIIKQGTHATTLKSVGEEAGYSRGLASNRFGSKEALFAQLVLQFNNNWTQELAARVDNRTGAQACLAALDAVEGFLASQSEDMKAMYILWYESISSHNNVRSHLAAYHKIYRCDVAHWVNEGIEAGEISADIDSDGYAFQFCSFIFGTVYQWLVAPEQVDLARQFAAFRKSTVCVFDLDI